MKSLDRRHTTLVTTFCNCVYNQKITTETYEEHGSSVAPYLYPIRVNSLTRTDQSPSPFLGSIFNPA